EGVDVADGVTDGDVTVTDGVVTCAVEAADEERDDDEGVGDAVGPLQPAVSTHKARTAHTAISAICFFMKHTSVNEHDIERCQTRSPQYIRFLHRTHVICPVGIRCVQTTP
ncbi:MAG: hypothetical protein ACXV4C_07230, partial [Halobacteriota archaeon]